PGAGAQEGGSRIGRGVVRWNEGGGAWRARTGVLPATISQHGGRRGERSVQFLQAVRRPPVVRVEEGDELTARVGEAEVARWIGAAVVLLEQGDSAGVGLDEG